LGAEDKTNTDIAKRLAVELVRALDGLQQVPDDVADAIKLDTTLSDIATLTFSELWIWKEDVQGKRFLDRMNRAMRQIAPAKVKLLFPGAFNKPITPAEAFAVLVKAVGLDRWHAKLSTKDQDAIAGKDAA
jgi:hypothetical protein